MAGKSIDIIISTVLKKTGIDAAKSALSSLSEKFGGFAKGVLTNLMNIQAGFSMLKGAIQSVGNFLKSAFGIETMTVQFKTFVGSIDEAREHVKMLQELGDTPPFSLEEFASASRSMMAMTDGVLGYKHSLELVGDAAAATGKPIDALAHEVGRAYAIIRDGQPIGRATMALRNMGVLTPEVAARMDELQKSGASSVEIWNELEQALGRYKGAMSETEKTGEGLVGAISANWSDVVREFSSACLDASKGALAKLLNKIKELRDNGTIAIWADKFASAMRSVANACAVAFGWIKKVVDAYEAVHNWASDVGAQIGGTIGALSAGASWNDALDSGIEARRMNVHERETEAQDESDRIGKFRAEAKKAAAEAKKAAAERERKEEERDAKIREELARKQAERDVKTAEELAKKKEEIEKSYQEKVADIERVAKGEEEPIDVDGAVAKVESARKAVIEAVTMAELDAAKTVLDNALSNLAKLQKANLAAIKKRERKKLEDSANVLREMHNDAMAILDKEGDAIAKNIERLKGMGAENPIEMAKNLDQAGIVRAERQAKIDEARFEKSKNSLEARMRKAGINDFTNPNEMAKLGRLSNLERATLERMRLDKAKQDAKDLEARKLKAAEDTKKMLDEISKQLAAVGL